MKPKTIKEKIEEAKSLIKRSIEKYQRIAVACSFGKDSMTVLHLALQVKSDIPVFAVMTPFKPKVTINYKNEIIKKYNLNIKEYISNKKVSDNLYKTDPDKCCYILKVLPTKEAVKHLNAWITGLRRTEGKTRENYKKIEKRRNLVKINPILDWTEVDVWKYLALNQIPPNPLYKEGYRSLGCEKCSVIISDDMPERAGRWKNTNKCGGECGIHTKKLK